jgi:uncharacterized small protein (DUF1192 family)
VVEYENRLVMLTSEIERLNKLIDEQRRSFTSELTKKLQQKSQEVEDWVSKYQRLEGTFQEYRRVEDQVIHYQQRVILLSAEVDRLNYVQIQIVGECDQMVKQIER